MRVVDGLVAPKLEDEAARESNQCKEPCHKRILRNFGELQNWVSAELQETGGYDEVREVHQSAKRTLQQVDRAMEMARERELQREKTELYHQYGKMEAAFTTERFNLQAEIGRLQQDISGLRTTYHDTDAQLRLVTAQFEEERQALGARLAQKDASLAEEKTRSQQQAQERDRLFSKQIQEREAYIASQASELTRLKRENEDLASRYKAERDTVAAVRKELEEEKEKHLCKLCFTRPKDGLIFPCLHFDYCFLCLDDEKSKNNFCPTCRGSMDGLLKSSASK